MKARLEPILPGSGALRCEGPPPEGSRDTITNCGGGPNIFQGRRARWLLDGRRPLCGTCKREVERAG